MCPCVIHWAYSQRDGELHDFIVGANRDNCHRNVVCSYSGFFSVCTVLYVIFYYICSIDSMHLVYLSVSLPEFVQHYILLISVTSKGTLFCGRATVVIHTITSTEPWKNIKAFYDSQVWWKLCFFSGVWEWDWRGKRKSGSELDNMWWERQFCNEEVTGLKKCPQPDNLGYKGGDAKFSYEDNNV